MKLLDLFCGAGGAAMGYYRAGVHNITGVDIHPQHHYPFKFVLGDALEYVKQHGHEYDIIHASPPCQAHSQLRYCNHKTYPSLIEPLREILNAINKPYVIENVVGAPLQNPVRLCGTMFGLKVYRHRLFETNPMIIFVPKHYPHHDNCPGRGRGISSKGFISVTGNGGYGIPNGISYARKAMGIDWMNNKELSQAIPPLYTEYICKQLFAHLGIREKLPIDILPGLSI